MDKSEPLQMSKQQEVGHDHCKCKAGIVAPRVVVESTVVPIDEHVSSPILVPKPNVVVESMVVPTVEHETNTLSPKPNIVVALENMEENRIPLTPSILKLDAHLHQQTKQVKNKMKVRLNNNQRKKIPKLQLIDESSSSTGPYGGPCTQHSDAQVDIQSPFTAIAGKKRKANQKLPTKTKLHLDESIHLSIQRRISLINLRERKFKGWLNVVLNVKEAAKKLSRYVKTCRGEKGDTIEDLSAHGDNTRGRLRRISSVETMEAWASQQKGKKLYIVLISLHGLIRGENMELGRDSTFGGV
ncbi:putative sucrose-phosphate synthase [Camellia lanceoleosa]|uniref:Sucrose-phosphate synthase n=1 Tax=Camellia lanceoleosa TaxID=1840588 RepID=A0ACC0IMT2_9ERIC|nr:putative sucrose-phosphate synthase [Camellia lanceoleosa]